MSQSALDKLVQLMAALRHPQYGCPWDLQQDYQSLLPFTLEEAYEVADAIEQQDMDALKSELGDLLFQVVFYSRLAEEESAFELTEVVEGIVAKLLRRHPHVFPDGTLESAGQLELALTEDEIKESWEKIKRQEREQRSQTGHLDDVPQAMPALSRAYKLQKRAARVGFDWPQVAPVFAKLAEETAEIHQAIAEQDSQALTEEIGDLLFTCVNLSRHLGVDPEIALRAANQKFVGRFETMEQLAKRQDSALERMDLDALDRLWEQAKTDS